MKVHRLIKASLSVSYLPAIHTSSLSTYALSTHLHVSSLMVASYITEMPQGCHLYLRTFRSYVVFSLLLIVMTEDYQELWSGTFVA